MTEVLVNVKDNDYKISVKGHAGYNPGNDIVCSAISCLTFAMAQHVIDHPKHIGIGEMEVEPGRVVMEYTVARAYKDVHDGALELFIIGLKNIQQKYIKNITLRVRKE